MSATRVALVTGSGKKRVGSAVADALAERGFAIAVHYRSSAAEAAETVAALRTRGVEAEGFPADLADESAVRGLIAAVLARFGRIDVLVNCAAIWQRKRLEDVTAADVRRHFDTNALGTFLCSQHAGLAMVKQPEGGLIVNLGDWAEVRPYLDYAAYFPSKGAVSTMTRVSGGRVGAPKSARAGQLYPSRPGHAAAGSARSGTAPVDQRHAGQTRRKSAERGSGGALVRGKRLHHRRLPACGRRAHRLRAGVE